MKLQLSAGDWATVAFFALAVALGCYGESKPNPSANGSRAILGNDTRRVTAARETPGVARELTPSLRENHH